MTLDEVYLSKHDQKTLSEKNSLHFQNKQHETINNNSDATICHGVLQQDQKYNITQKAVRISANVWPRTGPGKEMRKRASRSSMHGVEMRLLEPPHLLAGQFGLFAARPFSQFDIVGEYCGEVVPATNNKQQHWEYQARLEDKDVFPLGVDAEHRGNECRAINHFENIGEEPNVIMKICYVEELPRVIILCTRDLAMGEEFLLNYGDDYADAYIRTKKPPLPKKEEKSVPSVAWSEMAGQDEEADAGEKVSSYPRAKCMRIVWRAWNALPNNISSHNPSSWCNDDMNILHNYD